jgi:hypothetical protein
MNEQQTPIQEAISIITIAALLVAVGCYVSGLNRVPFLAFALLCVADEVYKLFPWFAYLRAPQIPLLVASAAVGYAFWLIGLAFAGLLAQWFSASQLAGIERQTARLKRNRAKIQQARRDWDKFEVR